MSLYDGGAHYTWFGNTLIISATKETLRLEIHTYSLFKKECGQSHISSREGYSKV